MRVQIAQQEAEHRELGDRPPGISLVERVDARSAEEAEEAAGVPQVPRLGRHALDI